MKLITKQDKANKVAESWKQAYYSFNTSHEYRDWFTGGTNNSQDKYNKLLALGDTPSPEDIETIIGNSSWTRLECSRCDKEVDKVVSFKGVASDEYGNTTLCKECITELYTFTLSI